MRFHAAFGPMRSLVTRRLPSHTRLKSKAASEMSKSAPRCPDCNATPLQVLWVLLQAPLLDWSAGEARAHHPWHDTSTDGTLAASGDGHLAVLSLRWYHDKQREIPQCKQFLQRSDCNRPWRFLQWCQPLVQQRGAKKTRKLYGETMSCSFAFNGMPAFYCWYVTDGSIWSDDFVQQRAQVACTTKKP